VGRGFANAAEIASASGKLWIADQSSPPTIEMVNPSDPAHPVAISSPSLPLDLSGGSDGNVWFTEPFAHALGRLNVSDPNHAITNFGVAQGLPANGEPSAITAGQDGNVWFTDPSTNALGKINPANPTTITEVAVPATMVGFLQFPSTRIVAAGGKLWFTEVKLNSSSEILQTAIGSYNPASNTWSEVVVPGGAGQHPYGLTVAPDGRIWFSVVSTTASLGVINPTTTPPSLTEIPVPPPAGGTVPWPNRIVAGPDGTIWFTDRANAAIGQYNPSSHNLVSQPIRASTAPVPVAFGITVGPDFNTWFTVSTDANGGPSTVGLVTVNPQYTGGHLVSIAAGHGEVFGIGGDHSVWVYRDNGGWANLGAFALSISVGIDPVTNQDELWVVGGDYSIYRYEGSWAFIGGHLASIAAGRGEVFGLGGNNAVYVYRDNGGWANTGASGVSMSVGTDASGANDELWLVGGNNFLYRYTKGSWLATGGQLASIAAGHGEVFGRDGNYTVWIYNDQFGWGHTVAFASSLAVGTDASGNDQLWVSGGYNSIWLLTGGAWTATGGNLVSIVAGRGEVFGFANADTVWAYNYQTGRWANTQVSARSIAVGTDTSGTNDELWIVALNYGLWRYDPGL
jgi:virginiamycin B lyase